MCGRFVSTNTPEDIASYFGAVVDAAVERAPLPDNYNVAPTNDIYAVVDDRRDQRADERPVLRVFRWGLVPSWAKDEKIGSKMINARAESLATKPAYKKLFASRRLIVPMDGFYEWQVVPGAKKKQPVFVCRKDGGPLGVAGLWATWRDPGLAAADGATPWLHSCTVITTDANATMAPIHDRMPVLLPESAWAEWLDPTNHDVTSLTRLLVPADDDLFEVRPVSTDVNNVRNNGAHLIERAEPITAA